MRSRHLIGWAVAGQLVYAASNFMVLTALARHASQADIGRFGLATAIITPIFWFSNLGLRTNLTTDAASKHSFLDFLLLRVMMSLTAYIAIVLIAYIAIDDPFTRLILLVYGSAKGAETISDLAYGALQKRQHPAIAAVSLSVRSALGAGLFALLLWSGSGLISAFIALSLVWAVVAVGWDIRTSLRMTNQKFEAPDRGKMLELARESLPLGCSDLLAGLAASAPRLAIGATMSLEALGQFTLVSYILQILTLATSAIGQAISPKLATYTKLGHDIAFQNLLRRLAMIVAAAGLSGAGLSIVGGSTLWRMAFGPGSEPSALLLALVFVAGAARGVAIILQTGVVAKRRFKDQAVTRLTVAVSLLVGSFVGAQGAGLVGVALVMTLVAVVHSYILTRLISR